MSKQILLNQHKFFFHKDALPLMIHGKPKAGASLFTMSVLADLYNRGDKVLVLTGYPMAIQEFSDQIETSADLVVIETQVIPKSIQNAKAIFVLKEQSDSFIKLTERVTDLENRVVLIKNVDLFSRLDFSKLQDHSKLIVSGDFSQNHLNKLVDNTEFVSKVFFSDLDPYVFPKRPLYVGAYIRNEEEIGSIKVVI